MHYGICENRLFVFQKCFHVKLQGLVSKQESALIKVQKLGVRMGKTNNRKQNIFYTFYSSQTLESIMFNQMFTCVNIHKGVLHPSPKSSMLSQNYQHLKTNVCISKSKLSKELKNGIKILVGYTQFVSYGSKQSKYCFDQ